MDLLRSSRGAHLEHINRDVVVIAVAVASLVRPSLILLCEERKFEAREGKFGKEEISLS